jgi:hypothetical protein
VSHRHDLVIDIDGRFVRAQCKTGRLRRTRVLPRHEREVEYQQGVRSRYRGEADLFLGYCADTAQVYAVDVEDVGSCEVKLRVAPTANNQEQGVRGAADYLWPA